MASMRSEHRHHLLAAGIALLLLCLATGLRAAENETPSGGWPTSTPEEQGMRSDLLADMLERVRWNRYRIDSVAIVRNGRLVMDANVHPRWKGRRHATYSVTKSVMSALIGIAIDQGRIEGVDTPVLDFFPGRTFANVDARKRAMTLEHVLTMTTGLRCRDSYRYGWAEFMKMQQSSDWAQFVLDLPMEAVPGETFEYCNGASVLLSAILSKATGIDTFEFARTHLFAPLGITDVSWSRGSKGIRNACCGVSLSAYDMAKFGQLFLDGGKWNGRQVISADWVERSTRRHVDAELFDHYGYQWWGDASGYHMAVGYKGQRVFVIPQKNMVAVFTGSLENAAAFAPKRLLDKFIIPAAASDAPLPANTDQWNRLAGLAEPPAGTQTTDPGTVGKHVWLAPDDGTAEEGRFVRRSRPAFRFEYPPASLRDETVAPTEIMRMRTRSGVIFNVNIQAVPSGVALAEAGPVSYAAVLKEHGSDIEITSNSPITLRDGTEAYRTEIRWNSRSVTLTTVVVSAYRDERWIVLASHHRSDVDVMAGIADTLVFGAAEQP